MTLDQAFSILRLRQAIAKPGPDKEEEDELIEAMWKNLKGDREGTSEHLQPSMMQPCSTADAKELSNDAPPMKPCSKPQVTAQEEKTSVSTASGGKGQTRYERIIFETSNVTSLNSNRDAALARKKHTHTHTLPGDTRGLPHPSTDEWDEKRCECKR